MKLKGNSAVRILFANSAGLLFFMISCTTEVLTIWAIIFFRYLGIVKNYQGGIVI